MTEQIAQFFFNQGTLGVVILVLAGVIIWMQKRLDTKDKEIKELNDKLGAAADLRLKDSKDNTIVNNSLIEKYATLAEKGVTNDSLMMQAINGIAAELRDKK